MKKTIGITLVTLLLILSAATNLKAQDKYEYASLCYYPINQSEKYKIFVSENGTYKEITGKVTEGYASGNVTPLNILANEMSKDSWEVYNTQIAPGPGQSTVTYYFLKRKVK